jgi:hypothetical protein
MNKQLQKLFYSLLFLLVGLPFANGQTPTTISVYPTFSANNGTGMTTFNFENTNSYAITITGVSAPLNANALCEATLWTKPTPVSGSPGGISVANGWTAQATNTFTSVGGSASNAVPEVILSNISVNIPANTTVGMAIGVFGSPGATPGRMRYYTIPTSTAPILFSGGGVNLITGNLIGYGYTSSTTTTPINLRGFAGTITFVAAAPPVPCSGIPTAGTATGPTSVCAGGPIALALTGYSNLGGNSIQWESSPAGAAAWAPITGATNAYFNTTQTAATDYRAVVSCSNGGGQDVSNTISASMNPSYLCYCSPNTGVTLHGTTANYITNVAIANTPFSVSSSTIAPGGYTLNYPLTATNTISLTQGQIYTLNATVASASYSTELWIDWDQSGTFDANEYTLLAPGTIATTSIQVPATATPGLTGMRLRNAASATTVHGASGACANVSTGRETEDYLITVVAGVQCSGAPASAGTISSNVSSVCVSGNVSFSVTNTPTELGITYQWESSPAGQNTFQPIAGATGLTYNAVGVNANTDFRLAAICTNPPGGTGYSSNTITISVNNPQLASATGATRCGTGSVTLNASAVSGTVNWYAASTGGVPLATGANSYTTPSISTTTTYYAAASSGGFTANIGRPVNLTPADAYNTGTNTVGLQFDALSTFTINSVLVYPYSATNATAGSITIGLQNSAGVTVQTTTVSVTGYNTPVATTVTLNFTVPPGTGYRLLWMTPNVGITGLYREYTATPFNYPYTVPGVASITSSYSSGATVAYYYYFYNWSISTGCEGARVPVTATVTTPPAYTVSATPDTLCMGGSSTLAATSANAYTYTWTPGGTGSNINVSPTSTTKYYLTGLDANNCGIYDSVTVYVKSVPATVATVAFPTSICVSGSVNLSLNPVPMQGILIQWQKDAGSGYVDISGANASTYNDPVTTNTSYRARFYCNNSLIGTSTPVSIPYSNPSILSTVPGSRCGAGSVTLLAMGSAGSTVNWFNTPTGGTSLGTGNAFVTPSLSSTTTYYAAPISGGASAAQVPELMYYKFDLPGTSVANEASSPVGANPAPVTGLTIGGTGQFGTGLQGAAGATATNRVDPQWTGTHTGSWTISFWMNVPTPPTTRYMFGNSTGNGTFRCFIGGAANGIRLTGGVPTMTLDMPAWTAGTNVVTYVYNQTLGTVSGYLNGVFQTSATPGASYPLVGTAFVVGSQGTSIEGTMDEFRMYNRALSAAEIASTWNIMLPGGCEGPRVPVTATINGGASGTGLSTGGTFVGLSQADGTTIDYVDPCNDKIATVADATGGNVLGNTSAIVLTSSTVQTQGTAPYVPRVFDIAPSSNGPATVSLYVLQSEFNAYNSFVLANNPGLPLLPTSPTDVIGISNIVLTQYHGAASAGTAGPFGLYSNANVQLIPNSFITATSNGTYWTLTFPVTGFSGFFVHTGSTPLIIDLKSISATNIGSRNRVDWSTASEALGDMFAIERSADGRNFAEMGTVAAKGQASAYSYWDENPYQGVSYYRVKMINKSGSVFYSSIVMATMKTGGAFIVEAYPNPVTDILTVRLIGTAAANPSVAIADVTGKTIRTITLTGNTTAINMSDLAPGVYLIKYSDVMHSQTFKVNKQ